MSEGGGSDFQEELVKDFLLESAEGLESFERDMLAVENGENSPDLLNQVFRVVHTIKGTAGCLGFNRIESIAHSGESVLSLVRDGELPASKEVADAMLRLSDALKAMLDLIESCGSDAEAGDFAELRELLEAVRDPDFAATPVEPDSVSAAEPEPRSEAEPAAEADGRWGLFGDEEPAAESKEETDTQAPADERWGLFDSEPEPEKPVPPSATESSAANDAPEPAGRSGPVAANSTIRVDIDLLDRLMNMVGELVLSRNQLLQVSQKRDISQSEVSLVSQRLNQVTSELQQNVMKTRMQPIGTVWGKYPRIVRDLAGELGKKVSLQTFGADTELDRTIIEAIKDPLTHIIRNAVDHGIETPDTRLAVGKSEEAQLFMRAFHEGGQVNIEIIDDGAGIDGDRIRRKAIEKGLISEKDSELLSEREMVSLIFLPGFSTAEKLSSISGRGVGMDVVKTNIEKIGGSVSIDSVRGEGTTLRIKIPLTLAIVPVLVAKSAGQRFAIPQVNLVELVRLEGEQMESLLEKVYDSPVFRLRGNLLPLVFLSKALKLSAPVAKQASSISIVVLRAERQLFGLVVEEVCDTEEIVVKPLGHLLKGLPTYAGATIMGDGSVAIILDSLGIAQLAGVLNASKPESFATEEESEEAGNYGMRNSLILFSLPGWGRLAVSLDDAERLEEFEADKIIRSGRQESVLYRGGIMKLVRLADHLRVASEESSQEQVIVYKIGERFVGLVVGEIHDIIEESVSLEPAGEQDGILGSAVIQGEVTDLVDVPRILKAARIDIPQNVA